MCVVDVKDFINIDVSTKAYAWNYPSTYFIKKNKLNCRISIPLRLVSEFSPRIAESCKFIGWLSGQRAHIADYEIIKTIRQKTAKLSMNVVLNVNIKGTPAWDLLHYLLSCRANKEFGTNAKVYELSKSSAYATGGAGFSLESKNFTNNFFDKYFFHKKDSKFSFFSDHKSSLQKNLGLNNSYTDMFMSDYWNSTLNYTTIIQVYNPSFFLYKPDNLYTFNETVYFQFTPALNPIIKKLPK